MVQLPEPFAELPRHPILYSHPSPIHPLPSLSFPSQGPRQTGIKVYAKREDHGAPLACAGNKYRKLEYIVPDILSSSPTYHYHEHHPTTEKLKGPATILVTEGAIQSNHTVQVAALARNLGLKALVLLSRGTGGGLLASQDQDAFVRSGNAQINRMLGAEVHILKEGDPRANDANPFLEELRARGERPYWIPGGASLHALGGLGYARAAFEIELQERELNLKGSGQFDYIFVACGSGSTVGGLIAGFKVGEPAITTRQVIGVLNSPTKPRSYHEARVLTFARRAAQLIGLDGKNGLESEHAIITDDVRLEDRFVGTGYGVLDAETKEAMEKMAQSESIILDPVYTGKVARAMMQWVREQEVQQFAQQRGLDEVNVLFIHTGGQAALGAYADVI
ncbi:Tryptophan synthase beta subunit-like PLP-dependent enzymes superfamily [Penicillium maclennaniae]|uniref:Tryptophan synthase beta subunit-like PLP-dependent enzymes superfamily n=1 Tax=Penicillium maclennaniae TaxID=1343394 RepID=UPI002542188E|nr:Tryptophan synthase beta subunit-like PLP-dependent enzymes superfamily [Penicillium maclennaniae]KAJ5665242.1 Tryptophan synthase beta subunit-like PLP-dependent enzymes superfamily [Penicillium maclennaniae]